MRFDDGLERTVAWYRENPTWWEPRLRLDVRRLDLLPARQRRPQALEQFFRRDVLRYESFYASPSTDGRRVFTIAHFAGKIYAVAIRRR